MAETEQDVAQKLIRKVEDNSLVLMEDWLKEARQSHPQLLQAASEDELRSLLYLFILRVVRFLGESYHVSTLVRGADLDLKQVFYEAGCFIVEAIEAQMEGTVGHSQKVKEYAAKMAGMLRWRDDEIADIEYAAAIHNIGLINDAHKLYLEPRRLSGAERERARHHAKVGADMLRPVEFLSNIVPMVHYHHSHYDGTGFPGGLKGDDIPLGARIICICDAFQAMTSPRPYRPAMSVSEALREIDLNSGKQFDPKLVPLMHAIAKGVSSV